MHASEKTLHPNTDRKKKRDTKWGGLTVKKTQYKIGDDCKKDTTQNGFPTSPDCIRWRHTTT